MFLTMIKLMHFWKPFTLNDKPTYSPKTDKILKKGIPVEHIYAVISKSNLFTFQNIFCQKTLKPLIYWPNKHRISEKNNILSNSSSIYNENLISMETVKKICIYIYICTPFRCILRITVNKGTHGVKVIFIRRSANEPYHCHLLTIPIIPLFINTIFWTMGARLMPLFL